MTLADRLRSALALAAIQNSPLAAVPVGDVREAMERLVRREGLVKLAEEWLAARDNEDVAAEMVVIVDVIKLLASIEAEERA